MPTNPGSSDRRAERARFLALIKTHCGNLSAIAKALTEAGAPTSRQALSIKLERYIDRKTGRSLLERAALARANGMVSGRRRGQQPELTRDQMLEAIAASESDEDAIARLGIKRRTFYRLRGDLAISRADVSAARAARRAAAAPAPRAAAQ